MPPTDEADVTDADAPVGAPRHYAWVVGVLLGFNASRAIRYVLTRMEHPWEIADHTPEQRAYILGYPLWMEAAWGLAVWGSVLGVLLLVWRSRWAYPVFAAATGAFLVSAAYRYALSDGAKIMGWEGHVATCAGLLFWMAETLYARAMTRRGVLR